MTAPDTTKLNKTTEETMAKAFGEESRDDADDAREAWQNARNSYGDSHPLTRHLGKLADAWEGAGVDDRGSFDPEDVEARDHADAVRTAWQAARDIHGDTHPLTRHLGRLADAWEEAAFEARQRKGGRK